VSSFCAIFRGALTFTASRVRSLLCANWSRTLNQKTALCFIVRHFASAKPDAPAKLTLPVPVSGHGSQVLAPPDHVEETDGWDEGKRVLARSRFRRG